MHILANKQDAGYTGLMANLYSAPPYIVGLGFLIIGGAIGDYFHFRLPIIVVQTCLGILGLARMLPSFFSFFLLFSVG